jgi:hypothetical protein
MNQCPTTGVHPDSLNIDGENVDGMFAIAFDEKSPYPVLRYARATNAAGTTWSRASTIVRGRLGGLGVMGSGSTTYAGHPYIVFHSVMTNGFTDQTPALNNPLTGMYITIAKTIDGLGDWTRPHFVVATDDGNMANGTVCCDPSGSCRPAFHIKGPNAGFWVAGNDDGGGTWTQTATPLDGGTTFVNGLRLALIAGRPALASYQVSGFFARFFYVRASNALGSSWPGTVNDELDGTKDFSSSVHMVDHGGVPLIVTNARAGVTNGICYTLLGGDADGNSFGPWNPVTGLAGQPRPSVPAFDGSTLGLLFADGTPIGGGAGGILKYGTSIDGGASWSVSTLDAGAGFGGNRSQLGHGVFIGSQFHGGWRHDDPATPLNNNPLQNRDSVISTT